MMAGFAAPATREDRAAAWGDAAAGEPAQRAAQPVATAPNQQLEAPPSTREFNAETLEEAAFELSYANRVLAPAAFGLIDPELAAGEGDHAVSAKALVYVALADLANALGFAIASSPLTRRADGFAYEPDRVFTLDIDAGLLTVDGAPARLDPHAIIARPDALYLSLAAAEAWFDLQANYQPNRFAIAFTAEQKPPRLAAEDRARRRAPAGDAVVSLQPRFNQTVDPRDPSWVSARPPIVDMNTSYQYRENTDTGSIGTLSALAIGQALGLESEALLVADSDQGLRSVALRAGRANPAGVAGTSITSAFAGDVTAPAAPLVTRASRGRGVSLTTFPLGTVETYGGTDLSGVTQPGYDVELYRNGVLTAFTTADETGRYEFLDAELTFGANDFEIVSLGPQGQRRVERRSLALDAAFTPPGRLNAAVSLQEAGVDVVEIDADAVSTSDASGALSATAVAEVGVRDGLAVALGAARAPLRQTGDAESRDYVSASARAALGGGVVFATLAHDVTTGGRAAELGGRRRVGPLDMNAEIGVFDDFESPGTGVGASAPQATGALGLATRTPRIGPVPTAALSARGRFVEQVNGQTRADITLSTSARVARVAVRSELAGRFVDEDEEWRQRVGLSGRIGALSLRADVGGEVSPNVQVEDYTLNAVFNASDRTAYTARFTESLGTNAGRTASLGVSRVGKRARVSAFVSHSEDAGMVAGLQLSASFGAARGRPFVRPQPIARSGAVDARVFVDNDADGEFSDGDEPLPDVTVRLSGPARSAGSQAGSTDKKGRVLIPNPAAPGARMALEVDLASLPDPFLRPARAPVAVPAQAGVVRAIDVPIASTAEILGSVTFKEHGHGGVSTQLRAANVAVLITSERTGETITVKTSADGALYVPDVTPGTYRVRLDSEQLARLGLEVAGGQSEERVTITPGQELAFVPDFAVAPQRIVAAQAALEER